MNFKNNFFNSSPRWDLPPSSPHGYVCRYSGGIFVYYMKKLLLAALCFTCLSSSAQLVEKDKQVAKLNQFGNAIQLWQYAGRNEYYLEFENKQYTYVTHFEILKVGTKDDFLSLIENMKLVDQNHNFKGPNYVITGNKASDQIDIVALSGAYFFITKKHIKDFEKASLTLN